MLTFCEKCGNVMVLKEKSGRTTGVYGCRTCGLEKDMRVEKVEIREMVFEEPTDRLIPDDFKFPLV